MHVVNIVDHIHHLFNESKKSKFAYKRDRMEYIKRIKSNNFLLENNNQLLKSYIFNVKCTSFKFFLIF